MDELLQKNQQAINTLDFSEAIVNSYNNILFFNTLNHQNNSGQQ